MKITNTQLAPFSNALSVLSPAMERTQQAFADAKQKTPRVKGNLSYPVLAYRIGLATIAIAPAVRALENAQRQQLALYRIRPDANPDGTFPPERMWPSDGNKFADAMQPILDEEIDLGTLKPITWDILKKAGVIGGAPAKEDEIEFDGSIVAGLGAFLEGEPPDDAD